MRKIVAVVAAGMMTACATSGAGSCARGPAAGAVRDDAGGEAVCLHLAEVGCPEGRAPSCAEAFDEAQGGRVEDLEPACLLAACTAEQVRACGTVACP